MLACIVGIAFLTVSFDLRFFTLHVNHPIVVLTGLGTLCMVAGFNLTLYSRLNLVTQNKLLLRVVLGSIVVVCALGKIPVVVSESIPTATGQKVYRDALYVDIIFTLEGFFLCGLYIYLFRRKFMQGVIPNRRTRSFFRLLITAQTVVAVVDVAANVLLFLDYYLPSASTTPLRYAIKVKIEFVVLNRLVLFTQREAATVLPRFISNNEHISQHGAQSSGICHRITAGMDEIGRPRLEAQDSGSIPQYSRHSTLKSSRSLPDLSLYKIIDKRLSEQADEADRWSSTDIQYLGRSVIDKI
jgi:hypothetical protein